MHMTALLVCWAALIYHSPILLNHAEAAPRSRDKDRVIQSYDPCIHINDFSDDEQRGAANRECGQAFLALDENQVNSCHGWRHPACRELPGSPFRHCSCMISVCSQSGVTSDETKSFRECALDPRPEWYFTEQAAQASGFRELLKRVETSAIGARAQPLQNNDLVHAGSSSHNDTSGGSNQKGTSGGSNQKGTSDGSNKRGTSGDKGPYGTVRGKRTSRDKGVSHAANFSDDADMPERLPSHDEAGPSRRKRTVKAGGKIFQCNVCQNIYKTIGALKDHKISHKEDLSCQFCQRGYSSKTNFQKHIDKVHKGDVVVATRRNIDLNQDPMEEYNAKKPFACETCGARYAWEKGLKSHLKTHEAQSAYCTPCKRSFSLPGNYQAHLKLRHKELLKKNPFDKQ